LFHSIQWRITIWFVLLAIVSMAILGVYITNSVRDSQLDNLRTQLEKEAIITAVASLPGFDDQPTNTDLDALAKKLGNQTGTRITIIAIDGTVLGDSNEDPANMENHATRPEVMDALRLGTGESTRYSTTLGREMMYLAVPISGQEGIMGVARVALPLTQVEDLVNQVIIVLVIAIIIATGLVILAAWFITRMTTRPLREITRAARELASGKFGEKIMIDTRDESEELGHAFNEMSARLQEMLDTISGDKARLDSIMDNIADGVILTDSEGNLVITNQAAEKLFNIKGEAVKAKSFIETVRDHEINNLLVACLKTGREQTGQFELTKINRFIRVIIIPVVSDHNHGALILIQDLTELRSLQTMRREMVGNISHEFRTPLAGVKAMVETLQDGAMREPELAKDFLSRIEVEVDRMTQLVTELTELSRIETGKAELRIELLELNTLLEEVISELKPQVERQNLTLETTLAEDLPTIPADKDRLRQVMINLIHNAIKFNRPGGDIRVSTKLSGDSVIVEVADTGIGVAKENLPHIFERFYKADRARTGHGSGIGLAIVKHVVEAHGGKVRAKSEQDRGSTFTFNLPVTTQ
jgi:two-component system phosphate regulon sensor histidine kinase PhoR